MQIRNYKGGKSMEPISAIIMAAGTDTTMKSKKSKLAQVIYGKEVIRRAVEAVKKAGIQEVTVIVGKNREEIEGILKEEVTYLYQEQSLGTGHAIMQAESYLKQKQGKILIMNGNVPLILPETIQKLVQNAQERNTSATVLTAYIPEADGYGRIIRKDGEMYQVVEDRDATKEQKEIYEVNVGAYCFDAQELSRVITQLSSNSMGLYYITDVIQILHTKGKKIDTVLAEDASEVYSVNNKVELEVLTRILRRRINRKHMENGVTIEDTNSTYIYDDVEIGMDTVIRPNTTIKSGVIIGEDCDIGPNAYIREGCRLADKVKIGSFVEVKKAIIATGTKVPHLSYMGDCEIGEKCNIGCGTITCNYDGFHKSKTIIGDHSFIGSNTNLVAPVTLGDNVFVAAGSTITEDVPEDALAIARQRQTNKEGWNKKE